MNHVLPVNSCASLKAFRARRCDLGHSGWILSSIGQKCSLLNKRSSLVNASFSLQAGDYTVFLAVTQLPNRRPYDRNPQEQAEKGLGTCIGLFE